ncbi:MAG: group I intron-associated PD-(D/E)XK endonuclease [Terriglobales bacterium]
MSSPDSLPSFLNCNVGDMFAEADLSGEDLIRTRSVKDLGELAELAFSYKAASLGFGISKPLGENQPFDFILNAGHRLWKVQVKSTFRRSRWDAYAFRTLRANVAGGARAYSADDIDVLAAWAMPLDIWYIIPVMAFIPRKGFTVYPHRKTGIGQFEPFREAWCQLACSQEGASDNRISLEPCPASQTVRSASGLNSPCPLKKVLAMLQAQAPGKTVRRR